MAAAISSTRMIMPGPPPYGVSSTWRWRPGAKSRGFVRCAATSPASIALPSSDAPRIPSKISGNSVTSSNSIVGFSVMTFPGDDDLAAGHVHGHDEIRDQRDELLAGVRLALDDHDVLGAVPERARRDAQHRPVFADDGASDDVADVELARAERRQRGARRVHLGQREGGGG